ncbi:MAG: LysE family translocator [Pseudoxanthomonas sp.]
MTTDFFSPALFVALTAFAVGVASPGPSTMAIMATAMSQGRRQAIALAAGVVCGSLMWGLAASLGLSAFMQAYSWGLLLLKFLGGLYLLFLSWKAARSALATGSPKLADSVDVCSKWRAFSSGLGMHVSNPKAIFVWLSIVALALPPGASKEHALGVVGFCASIAAIVFFGYALAFSTGIARTIYSKAHRWLNATLSAVFAVAGVRLLSSCSAP